MLPAKSRERKCSTCRHYQASPLWRKGWCRNPLLYDRNTNHLVEADSLACNRTFIDYWEPLTEGTKAGGVGARDGKPRIAPSIPMDPVDARGNAVAPGDAIESSPYVTDDLGLDQTPVAGQRVSPSAPLYKPSTTTQRPPLSLIDDDYDDLLDDPRETKELAAVSRPGTPPHGARPGTGLRGTTRDRISRDRVGPRMPSVNVPRLSGTPLYAVVGVLAVLLVIAAAAVIFNRPNGASENLAQVSPSPTAEVQATPTGFGDPTATIAAGVVVSPTKPAIRVDVITVGGFVTVDGTGDGLLVRSSPARSGNRVSKIADGTRARVVDGPREADGFTWWKIDQFDKGNPDLTGWSVQDYLKPASP
jgi:hypothetical protein